MVIVFVCGLDDSMGKVEKCIFKWCVWEFIVVLFRILEAGEDKFF